MADCESFDDFLSSEIDENAVKNLVGSLETHLATPANTQASKTLTSSSYNNNHIGGNASTASAVRPLFPNATQAVIANPKGSVQNNISVSAHVPVSTPKISNAEILGISSIINAPSTQVSSVGVTHVNVNTGTGSNGNVHRIATPTIRIVTTSSSAAPAASTNSAQFISSGGVISQTSLPTAVTNNVHAVNVTRTNVTQGTPASNTIYNIATSIAEQKPMTVMHNGSAHAIQVPKDRPVLSQQGIVVKQEGGNQQFIVKQEIKPEPNAGISQTVAHSGALVNTALKGVMAASNPGNIRPITVSGVRTPVHPQHVTVMQQPTVVTTQASMTQPMQVVNVSGVQGAPRLAGIPQTVRPGQGIRVSTPVRITQQPTIAPRQPGAPTSQPQHFQLPPGMMLIRNEQGQFVLMPQQHAAGTPLHPSNIITTTVPTTTSTGIKPQRPTTPATIPRPGASTIVIQPSQPRGVTPVTMTQPSTVTRVISQPAANLPTPSISQPQPAVVPAPTNITSTSEINKMMLENVKKCRNFLATLIKLAANQPATTVKSVRDLIQGLIDGKVEPENFTQKLQQELKSSPQPYLVPFLKKSLPLLRQFLAQNKMGIEGINAPPASVMAAGAAQVAAAVTVRPQLVSQPAVPAVRPTMTTQPIAKMATTLQAQTQQRVTVTQSQAGITFMQKAGVAQPNRTQPAAQAQVPPLSQLGPSSSKVLMQTQRVPASAAKVTKGGGASAAVTAALAAHAAKADAGGTGAAATAHREKRKFEALREDNDDINDVATMGGVNLSEESKNILATNSELIGSQIRSCQDKAFLPQDLLMSRIAAIAKKNGLEGVSPDVARIISHATQERLRNLSEQLSVIAEHRMETHKIDQRFEQTTDVRSQLKFLEELGKVEQKRHEEAERERMMRAIKSRSKTDDPEQMKMKQRAKEIQQQEAEEVRQREANQTALRAIGPRKKRKLDFGEASTSQGSPSASSTSNGPAFSRQPMVIGRPRIKRVSMKDLQLLMERDKHLCTSTLYYKTFLK